jgi:hypothetical protein
LKKKAYQDVDIFTLPNESDALSELQPSTISKIYCILFKILKDNNVNYALAELKNEGSFYAVWNKIFGTHVCFVLITAINSLSGSGS